MTKKTEQDITAHLLKIVGGESGRPLTVLAEEAARVHMQTTGVLRSFRAERERIYGMLTDHSLWRTQHRPPHSPYSVTADIPSMIRERIQEACERAKLLDKVGAQIATDTAKALTMQESAGDELWTVLINEAVASLTEIQGELITQNMNNTVIRGLIVRVAALTRHLLDRDEHDS